MLKQVARKYSLRKKSETIDKLKEKRSFIKDKLGDRATQESVKGFATGKMKSLFASWQRTVRQTISDASSEAMEVIKMESSDTAASSDVNAVGASIMAPLRLRLMFVANVAMTERYRTGILPAGTPWNKALHQRHA